MLVVRPQLFKKRKERKNYAGSENETLAIVKTHKLLKVMELSLTGFLDSTGSSSGYQSCHDAALVLPIPGRPPHPKPKQTPAQDRDRYSY
eukprot:scaffold132400_cov19-Tisochrysis_lutea.AAC.1